MTTENDAVNEEIASEAADVTLSQIMNEMAAMVTLNQALNNALWIASDKLGKANQARDKAAAHLKHSGLDWMHEIITIVEVATTGGTHRDKDSAMLEAVRRLMALIKNIQWGIHKANGIAAEEISGRDDPYDLPF